MVLMGGGNIHGHFVVKRTSKRGLESANNVHTREPSLPTLLPSDSCVPSGLTKSHVCMCVCVCMGA